METEYPTRIDIEEWKRRYPGEDISGLHDVLDFGYWYPQNGVLMYESPAEEWRVERELLRKEEL